jgi:hypothetical protein
VLDEEQLPVPLEHAGDLAKRALAVATSGVVIAVPSG